MNAWAPRINESGKNSGFTIVELLIVVVVIAILAAITIVSYNGIQSRAKNSSAQSAATTTVKKAEAYNTEVGHYPIRMSVLTSASPSTSYYLSGITYSGILTTASKPSEIVFYACGSGNPANADATTTSNVTGGRVYYFDYQNSVTRQAEYGTVTGTGIACFGRN